MAPPEKKETSIFLLVEYSPIAVEKKLDQETKMLFESMKIKDEPKDNKDKRFGTGKFGGNVT